MKASVPGPRMRRPARSRSRRRTEAAGSAGSETSRRRTCLCDKDRNIVIELVEEGVAGHKATYEDAVEGRSAEEVERFCEVAEQETKGNEVEGDSEGSADSIVA